MFDDDAARRALQALTDEPAPPATTTLDQVVRRGKRRVLVQRASSVAVVMAVVAVIGVGAMLLRTDDDNGGGVQVGDTPVLTTEPTTPPSTMPLPGWKAIKAQMEATGSCTAGTPDPGRSDVRLPSKGRINTVFTAAVAEALGTTRSPLEWKAYEPSRAFAVIEVDMDNGPGQVQLQVGTYSGKPVEAADAMLAPNGTCSALYRRVLTDGTVLQLYQDVTFNAKAPAQKLRVFRPGGLMYVVTSAGYSDTDYAASGIDPEDANPVGVPPPSGRGKLPLTEVQLALVGVMLVKGIEK
jgi:hypothetical protein